MNFNSLEKICRILWGRSWQSELARTLDIDRRTVNGWKRQNVPKWVAPKIIEIVRKRKNELIMLDMDLQ
jgi:DNA-binding XRE family transcriptional regulator